MYKQFEIDIGTKYNDDIYERIEFVWVNSEEKPNDMSPREYIVLMDKYAIKESIDFISKKIERQKKQSHKKQREKLGSDSESETEPLLKIEDPYSESETEQSETGSDQLEESEGEESEGEESGGSEIEINAIDSESNIGAGNKKILNSKKINSIINKKLKEKVHFSPNVQVQEQEQRQLQPRQQPPEPPLKTKIVHLTLNYPEYIHETEKEDCLGIKLISAEIPQSCNYMISAENMNNKIFFKEDVKIVKMAEITEGNYTIEELLKETGRCMTEKGNSEYKLTLEPITGKVKISSEPPPNSNVHLFNLVNNQEGTITEHVFGFENKTNEGSLEYTSKYKFNLYPPPFIFLLVENEKIKVKNKKESKFTELIRTKINLNHTEEYCVYKPHLVEGENKVPQEGFVNFETPVKMKNIRIKLVKHNGKEYNLRNTKAFCTLCFST